MLSIKECLLRCGDHVRLIHRLSEELSICFRKSHRVFHSDLPFPGRKQLCQRELAVNKNIALKIGQPGSKEPSLHTQPLFSSPGTDSQTLPG